jgi:hypothetical protein
MELNKQVFCSIVSGKEKKVFDRIEDKMTKPTTVTKLTNFMDTTQV